MNSTLEESSYKILSKKEKPPDSKQLNNKKEHYGLLIHTKYWKLFAGGLDADTTNISKDSLADRNNSSQNNFILGSESQQECSNLNLNTSVDSPMNNDGAMPSTSSIKGENEPQISQPHSSEVRDIGNLLNKFHVSDVGKTKIFVCSVCGRNFPQEKSLENHKKYHTGDFDIW